MTVLRRRWPVAEVLIYPVPVQGIDAAQRIRRMLLTADARGECDLLILTRGGGSLEDLMPFNDEALVRAIHGSGTPLISAVGHEIDVTLSDFVADRRAPTPSAAAEIAVPDSRALVDRFATLERRLQRFVERGAVLAIQDGVVGEVVGCLGLVGGDQTLEVLLAHRL